MSDDGNIKVLNVKFRKPRIDGPILTVAENLSSCNHKWFFVDGEKIGVEYVLLDGEPEVECGSCHAKLDPIWVLRQLALEESTWQSNLQRFEDKLGRLAERSRTKCVHCGKQTPISLG